MAHATADTAEPAVKIVYTGFCNGCQLTTETLHKCPKCRKYVARPFGSARQLATELRRGRKDIRDKYKPELERLAEVLAVAMSANSVIERDAIQAKIGAITKTMKAEISAFLNPPNFQPSYVSKVRSMSAERYHASDE